MSNIRSEEGVVAVEFALVVPLLLMILFVIVEFGYAFNAQISVTHAAREAARTMAITKDWTDAQNAALASSPSLSPAKLDFPEEPACVAGAPVEVGATGASACPNRGLRREGRTFGPRRARAATEPEAGQDR